MELEYTKTYKKFNEYLQSINDNNFDLIDKKICKLMEIKYQHTMRVVEHIKKLAEKLNMSIDFTQIVAVLGLLHDIGRFEQAIKYQSFYDQGCYGKGITHGNIGYQILNNQKVFDELEIYSIYRPSLSMGVKLHTNDKLPSDFSHRVEDKFMQINPSKLLTGGYQFNEYEKQIISVLLEMLRDADKLDILYQRSIGVIKPIPEYMYVENDGIDNVANRWGIGKSVIIDNNLDNSSKNFKIPVVEIPIEKLILSKDVTSKMTSGDIVSLRELHNRKDFSFVTGLWWHITMFLSDLNFKDNLLILKENQILEKIYSRYPEEYHLVIDQVFKYASEVLIEERLEKCKKRVYLNNK